MFVETTRDHDHVQLAGQEAPMATMTMTTEDRDLVYPAKLAVIMETMTTKTAGHDQHREPPVEGAASTAMTRGKIAGGPTLIPERAVSMATVTMTTDGRGLKAEPAVCMGMRMIADRGLGLPRLGALSPVGCLQRGADIAMMRMTPRAGLLHQDEGLYICNINS